MSPNPALKVNPRLLRMPRIAQVTASRNSLRALSFAKDGYEITRIGVIFGENSAEMDIHHDLGKEVKMRGGLRFCPVRS